MLSGNSTIFISFSSVDDDDKFIEIFLNEVFKQKQIAGLEIGRGVYFYKKDMRQDYVLDTIKREIQNGQLMISFVSQNYFRSKVCLQEAMLFFDAFSHRDYEKRHFIVDLDNTLERGISDLLLHPDSLDLRESIECVYRRIKERMLRSHMLQDGSKPIPRRFPSNTQVFEDRAHDLRAGLFLACKDFLHSTPLPLSAPIASHRTRVYLAPAAKSLSRQLTEFESELTGNGSNIDIVKGPEWSGSAFPSSEMERFVESLTDIDLIVQFLGQNIFAAAEPSDSEIPTNLQIQQFEKAIACLERHLAGDKIEARVFLWDAIIERGFYSEADRHILRKFPKHAATQSLKELADDVARKAGNIALKNKPLPSLPAALDQAPVVHISGLGPDLEEAREAQQLLFAQDIWTTIPPSGSIAHSMETTTFLLSECDHHLVLNREGINPVFTSRAMQDFHRARRGRPVRVNAALGAYDPQKLGLPAFHCRYKYQNLPKARDIVDFVNEFLNQPTPSP